MRALRTLGVLLCALMFALVVAGIDGSLGGETSLVWLKRLSDDEGWPCLHVISLFYVMNAFKWFSEEVKECLKVFLENGKGCLVCFGLGEM